MHEKEVGGIFFGSDLLGYSGSHGNCGNSGRSDKRINLTARSDTHELTEQYSGKCTERECYQTENDDLDGIEVKESLCGSGCTYARSEEDNNDLHHCI